MHGIYALRIRLCKDVSIRVGAIGKISFNRGYYVYVGSAQRNLEKRVERHLRKKKKLFWHIDYLLSNEHAKIEKVLFRQADKSAECALARELGRQAEPVAGFGCSDCRCLSHLFWFPESCSLQEWAIFSTSHGWSKLGERCEL